MPKEKRNKMIGALVPPSIKKEVEAICVNEDRSISTVGYMLLMRALELYRLDGSLRNNESLLSIVAGLAEDLYSTPEQKKPDAAAKQSKVKLRRTA
jgi:hypothetical protein